MDGLGSMSSLHSIEPLLNKIHDYWQDEGNLNVGEIEKMLVSFALDAEKGSRTGAAKLLNVSVRTIRNKINEYRLGETI